MQRLTITIDDALDAELDRFMRARGYDNRSEALRDLARAGLAQATQNLSGGHDCIGALVYVYDHAARQLGNRLVQSFHERHDVTLATMHVHLDHDSCMEVAILKGRDRDVQSVADQVIAERGVRYGRLLAIPVKEGSEVHAHGAEPARRHSHSHLHHTR
jgi:CopG family transcriptional regulator, nickel-responsive regulator